MCEHHKVSPTTRLTALTTAATANDQALSINHSLTQKSRQNLAAPLGTVFHVLIYVIHLGLGCQSVIDVDNDIAALGPRIEHVSAGRMAIVKYQSAVVHPDDDRTRSLNLFRYIDIAASFTAGGVGLVDEGLGAWKWRRHGCKMATG